MVINTHAPENSILNTDLYQLTMAAEYHRLNMNANAVFEVFARKFPINRKAMVMCGLSDVFSLIASNRKLFSEEDLIYLRGLDRFSLGFLDYLGDLDTNQIHMVSMPEGMIFFENEPILRIRAPMIVAQLLETPILNALTFQISVATKAVRISQAAKGCSLAEFSARRCQSPDSALRVARAAYMAGFHSTSNVEAGKKFGIPVSGTVAHSFITAHDDEGTAFIRILNGPRPRTALLDTYDTKKAIRRLIALDKGVKRIGKVRIDSGNLAELSRYVRNELDKAGRQEVGIICSGDLDEYKIAALLKAKAPINGFGVGTALGACTDAPALGLTYKLVNYDNVPRIKTSCGKATMPGPRNVVRREWGDCIILEDNKQGPDPEIAEGTFYPLLGNHHDCSLETAREFLTRQNEIDYLSLDCRKKPCVRISDLLESTIKQCKQKIKRRNP